MTEPLTTEYKVSWPQPLRSIRSGGELHVETEVDPRALEQQVPFNFLQPIVENAFTHGFHESPEKTLRIEVKVRNALVIRITNSGVTLTAREYYAVNQAMRSSTAHGLSMINHKLRVVYDDRYDICMSLAAWDKGGSTFTLTLPYDGVLSDGR